MSDKPTTDDQIEGLVDFVRRSEVMAESLGCSVADAVLAQLKAARALEVAKTVGDLWSVTTDKSGSEH